MVLTIKGDWHGSREVILSLSAEEDVSYLRKDLPEHGEGMDHALYVLFRMFCGDRLHIVAYLLMPKLGRMQWMVKMLSRLVFKRR